jgi:hypothetical protein
VCGRRQGLFLLNLAAAFIVRQVCLLLGRMVIMVVVDIPFSGVRTGRLEERAKNTMKE